MESNNPNLKRYDKDKVNYGNEGYSPWTIPNIEAGFENFYDKYGHYPTVEEVDDYEYLPTSKLLQRNFGGIQELRKVLNLRHKVSDYNKGPERSLKAGIAVKKAHEYEEKYFNFLIKQIPEVCVHEHKVLRSNGYKTDTDFFIYIRKPNVGVGIDLFEAASTSNLFKQLRIKEVKYSHLHQKIFFVCMNNKISQEQINSGMQNRKTDLPKNIEVYNIDVFNQKILPDIVKKANSFFVNQAC